MSMPLARDGAPRVPLFFAENFRPFPHNESVGPKTLTRRREQSTLETALRRSHGRVSGSSPAQWKREKKKKGWVIFAPYIRFLENLAIRMNYLWAFIGEYKENYFLRFPSLFAGKSSN